MRVSLPGDPSLQVISTLGPKEYAYYLLWAIWIPRVCKSGTVVFVGQLAAGPSEEPERSRSYGFGVGALPPGLSSRLSDGPYVAPYSGGL